jgi:hypothetical protein
LIIVLLTYPVFSWGAQKLRHGLAINETTP